MRFCAVCETPYQCLNILNFICNQKEYVIDSFDLYIGTLFPKSDDIAKKISSKDIFTNVYTYSYRREEKNKISFFFARMEKFAFSRKYIKFLTNNKKISLSYDVIMISTMSRMATAIISSLPNVAVWHYDDGLGSYIGKQAALTPSFKRSLLMKVKRINHNRFTPKMVFLNNPCMSRTKWEATVCSLPSLLNQSAEFNELLNYVFDYSFESYKKKRFIFLGQPIRYDEESKFITAEILHALEGSDSLYRMHPLEKKVFDIPIDVDECKTSWELLCRDIIQNDCVLIGYNSTAQFIPKMVYNSETKVIFTAFLYKHESSANDELIQLLIDSYTNKLNVYAPRNIQEYFDIIKKLKGEKNV